MSLQSLVSGSECATSSNPLSQVLKHSEGDRSLQQDRAASSSSAQLHHLPSTVVANEHELALARQFFDNTAQAPVPGPAFALPQHLPPAELHRMQETISHGPTLNEGWTMGHQHYQELKHKGTWADEFSHVPISSPIPSLQSHDTTSHSLQPRPSYLSPVNPWGMPVGTYGMNMGSNLYQSNYGVPLDQVKGKENSWDADFHAAFDQATASLAASQTQAPKISEVDSTAGNIQESLTNLTLENNKEESVGDQSTDPQAVLDNIPDSKESEDLAQWEAQFNQLMNSQREEGEDDFGPLMQQVWEGGMGDYGDDALEEPIRFDDEGLPILGEYVFDPNNKYLEPSMATPSALNEAKTLLEQNGSLTEAALLLEAAIQKGELGEGGYEAWVLLGETKNMDERENEGLRALVEGARKAAAAGTPGPGMLSLAISYTNESFEKAAHATLLQWLRARFPSHPVSDDTIKAVSTNASWDTHARVTDVFLNLARHQHSEGYLDPDVQIGLGILFYSNAEYDRAKDCFESALSMRPKDYVLWNRLGSSLSNGSKPEEALGAYREALRLRPTYTRAIYNVGVACLNIGVHKEAVEHFLSALAMQESTGAGSSQQLRHTLRRAFLAMDRADLAEMARPDARADLDAFRREGFDF